jgi:NAD(P)-dependent dehydrogenase (short-subunit alcohol dehydrogenase family)
LSPFITDRNALIIGATRGLGYALAETAIRQHHIRAIGLGRSAGPDVIALPGAVMIKFDLKDPETWGRALDAVGEYRPDFVVWNAGIHDKRPLVEQKTATIDAMIDTHLRGPLKFLQRLHRRQMAYAPLSERRGKAYQLIVISSVSSFKLREHEALYCALEAAKSCFARQYAGEIAADLPGSKITLINPGGMKTDLLKGYGFDLTKMMDPFHVAEIIWREALIQTTTFAEINILRLPDGSPRLERGAKTPESPK